MTLHTNSNPSRPLQRRSFLKLAGLTATSSAFASGLQPPLPPSSAEEPCVPVKVAHRARNLYLNQTGYLPNQPKIATVILALVPPTDPESPELPPPVTPSPDLPWTFDVLAADTGQVVLSGALAPQFFDPLAGDHVTLADLSALRQPGRYHVRALGHTGDVFTIADTVYAAPLRLAMRAFYGQRCGTAVDLGDGYKHRKCHQKGEFSPSSGRQGKLKNAGGWHDAGDYGRYIVNSGITCGMLLWAWELYPAALGTLTLNIPESGKALPDYLAEIKWNLDWMLTLQDPADGGVWHKQTSNHFCAFILPEKDHLPSEVIGTGQAPYKSTCATADLAAVMAIAARCYQPFDPAFAAHCLTAARQAFTWSQAHPSVSFKNPPQASLLASTATRTARTSCSGPPPSSSAPRANPPSSRPFSPGLMPILHVQTPSWGNVTALALWTYVLAHGPEATTNETCVRIRQATQIAADHLLKRARGSGYGTTLAPHDFGWGSNSTAANQSMLLLIADLLKPDPELYAAALGQPALPARP